MNSGRSTPQTDGKILLVLPEPLASRMFIDCGIVAELQSRLGDRLELLVTFDLRGFEAWLDVLKVAKFRTLNEIMTTNRRTLPQRAHAVLDLWLDERFGFFPLALRFNMRNNLHTERMAKGHGNGYLDLSHVGPLPHWAVFYNLMFKWLYCKSRYVEPALRSYLAKGFSAIVTSHLQHPSMTPFIVQSRTLGIPLVGNIASWDHLVGKGVVFPHCRRYLVLNNVMKDDLTHYHGIEDDRIAVTGWPQTDVYFRKRDKSEYKALLASYRLDAGKPCVVIMGNSATNAPYEPAFVDRFVRWWESSGSQKRFNVIFRPHPKDREWNKRFDMAQLTGKQGLYVQTATYTDLNVLTLLLQNASCVVTNAGTILLDSLVNDRPAVCVLYDEGAPPGTCVAYNNTVGLHYRELMESSAFYSAKTFEDVVAGVEACLERPEELAEPRKRIARNVVGEVDGKAGMRMVDAILDSVTRPEHVSSQSQLKES